jgi:hypothetical protein
VRCAVSMSQGKYQPKYLAKNAAAARTCVSCPRGKTTKATGAVSQVQCSGAHALNSRFQIVCK